MSKKFTNIFIMMAITIPFLLNAAQTEQKVFKDGPADKAGLEMNDIVISFDGEKVYSPKDLSSAVRMKKVNSEVELQYYRDGETKTTKVTIERRKSPEVFMQKPARVMKQKMFRTDNSVFLGVKVENLSDQLREYFQVSEGLGVLVSEVIEDSPAHKAGLKAGDVITKIADRDVKNYRDLIRGLNYFDPEDEVVIYYIRDKKDKSVKVTLAEPQDKFEKILWIDDADVIHDFDFHKFHDFDEDEIEMKLDGLDKKIEIEKEIRNQDEV
jgi:C-terminal processing protease CtpA/Prc